MTTPTRVASPERRLRSRRTRLADIACGAGLLAGWFLPVALASATPVLLAHHDTLLEALSGSAASIVFGGSLARVGRASLVLVVLAPLCGIALADVFLWWAGRRWGDRLVSSYRSRSARSGRWIDRADRWVLRHGPLVPAAAYFLPVPNALIYLSCGAAGMPLLTFVIGDAVGTLLWTSLLVTIGWSAGRHGVTIVDGIQHYDLLVLVGMTVGVVLWNFWRRRGVGAATSSPAVKPSPPTSP